MSTLFYVLAGMAAACGVVFLFIDVATGISLFGGCGGLLLLGALFKLIALSKEQVTLLRALVPEKPSTSESRPEDDGWSLKK